MRTNLRWPLAAAIVLLAGWASAQSTPNPALLILSKQDRTPCHRRSRHSAIRRTRPRGQ